MIMEQLKQMNIRLDTLGRVPVNNGSFYDPIDASGQARGMTMLNALGVVQTNTGLGVTTITLADTSVFEVGDNITILDDVNEEVNAITGITVKTITVSATTNAYKKGAFVVRTNTVVKDNKLKFGTWGTFKVDVKEVM